ncbi:MAG: hypothetical protein ABW167_00905 [Baekduia sp.]
MAYVIESHRDPRAEKRRNFRRAGHCRRARCGICHPEKRWAASRRRALVALAVDLDGR